MYLIFSVAGGELYWGLLLSCDPTPGFPLRALRYGGQESRPPPQAWRGVVVPGGSWGGTCRLACSGGGGGEVYIRG